MKYRKKPVVIEAVQWTGENHAEMCEFIDPEVLEIKPKEGVVIQAPWRANTTQARVTTSSRA